MTEKPIGRGSPQFPLRLPEGMRERIAAAASENGRSMNSEIVSRLEFSFIEQASDKRDDALGRLLGAINDNLSMMANRLDALEQLVGLRVDGKND